MLMPSTNWIIFILFCLVWCRAFAPCCPNRHSSRHPHSFVSTSADDVSDKGISIGFIGCGTIASAIATGIATQNSVDINSIVVTRRSAAKSAVLQNTFADLVTISDDNQKILDQCQYIFLTVLPQQTSSVLQSLTFKSHHSLISLVSTASLDDLVADSRLEATNVSKMICLPSVARHQGVCLHCFTSHEASTTPSDTLLTRLFHAMGGVVTLDSESDLQACMMTTCTMGPLYGMMKYSRDWLLKSTTGLTKEQASFLVIKQIVGAVKDADRIEQDGSTSATDPNRLEKMIDEQTPGGLNEQALANYERLGGPDGQFQIMDAILSRIRGQSDGSV
ncbi:pyrroline-5-carboxylate reductase [Nitzschia inconspicua]|uniref:Pyrroline-5-carboxylate reductase n=1 Tax=Nitzschia inconspicua TaxID=303405 RepID=A0A9K3PGW8_9STRA|nr:pyrroline-5-carboxylate reductase [Nitzschia inconspicua]